MKLLDLQCHKGHKLPYLSSHAYIFIMHLVRDGRVKLFFESSRVRVISKYFRVESSRVESPVFPSRVKSSQIIFSIISFSVYFDKNINKFFMTHYSVPSFYARKNKNSSTEDKMT
jgi:hypothetical protein